MPASPLRAAPLSPVHFETLLNRLDVDFAAAPSGLIERFRFTYEGLTCDVRRIAHGAEQRFVIHVVLGYLPFSIESVERREAIKTIVAASRNLPKVRFGVTAASKITASALLDLPPLVEPDFVFYPLILFLQEARPFMQLLGQYLE